MHIASHFRPATDDQEACALYVVTGSTALQAYFQHPMEISTAADQHRDLVARGGSYIVAGNYPAAPVSAALNELLTKLFEYQGASVSIINFSQGMVADTDGFVLALTLGQESAVPPHLDLHVGVQLEMFEQQLHDLLNR